MIGYAARAVPWRLVLAGSTVAAALLALTSLRPEVLWPLQGTAVGVLAATAAWSMDERAAVVVDTLPRSLAWRTAARATALVAAAASWAAAVLLLGGRLPDHPEVLVLQGVAALVATAALTTWRRARGDATPGLVIAPVLVGAAAAVALARPVPDRLPVFPVWDHEPWGRSGLLWATVLGAGLAVLAVALSPRAAGASWPRAVRGARGRRPGRPRTP